MTVDYAGLGRSFYAEKLVRMAGARLRNLIVEIQEGHVYGAIKTAAEIELLADMAGELGAKVKFSLEEERLIEKANIWAMKAWDAVSSERY